MALISRSTTRPAVSATRARQGRMGRDVFWVLLISTALAALALFAAWMWRANQLASTEPNNGRQPADARSFSAPEPAPVAQPPQGAAADR